MSQSTPRFSSRWGFLLSALGIAVGTGNIWRFPRIAASNGGDVTGQENNQNDNNLETKTDDDNLKN